MSYSFICLQGGDSSGGVCDLVTVPQGLRMTINNIYFYIITSCCALEIESLIAF